MSDNIIFMGTSKFAVPILEKISESKLNISAVYTQPPKKSNRGMRIQKTPIHVKSELLGLPIRTPNSLKNCLLYTSPSPRDRGRGGWRGGLL